MKTTELKLKRWKASLVILCLFFFFYPELQASPSEVRQGTKLFVWAKSGLSLRVEPFLSSSRIKILPYGAQITVIEVSDYGEQEIEVIKKSSNKNIETNALFLKGNWIQVFHEKDTGYIFDGYCHKLPPPLMIEKARIYEQLEVWAEREFGIIDNIDHQIVKNQDWSNSTTVYGKAIMVSEYLSTWGGESTFQISDGNENLGILILDLYYGHSVINSNNKESGLYLRTVKDKYDYSSDGFFVFCNIENYSFSVQQIGGVLILYSFWAT